MRMHMLDARNIVSHNRHDETACVWRRNQHRIVVNPNPSINRSLELSRMYCDRVWNQQSSGKFLALSKHYSTRRGALHCMQIRNIYVKTRGEDRGAATLLFRTTIIAVITKVDEQQTSQLSIPFNYISYCQFVYCVSIADKLDARALQSILDISCHVVDGCHCTLRQHTEAGVNQHFLKQLWTVQELLTMGHNTPGNASVGCRHWDCTEHIYLAVTTTRVTYFYKRYLLDSVFLPMLSTPFGSTSLRIAYMGY